MRRGLAALAIAVMSFGTAGQALAQVPKLPSVPSLPGIPGIPGVPAPAVPPELAPVQSLLCAVLNALEKLGFPETSKSAGCRT